MIVLYISEIYYWILKYIDEPSTKKSIAWKVFFVYFYENEENKG